MRSSYLLVLCLALMLAVTPAAAYSSELDVPQVTAVVHTPDVVHPLTYKDLHDCIATTARVMNLDDQEPPQIVILQFSSAVAKRIGVHANHVLRNNGRGNSLAMFYEVWLVGQDATFDLAHAVETVFELHFGTHPTPQERAAIVKRVVSAMNTTVDVKTLAGGSSDASR